MRKMMRKLTVMMVFSVVSSILFAQNIKQISKPEKPQYRVFYQMEHIRDLENPDVIHEEEMMLLVGEKSSLFTSFTKLKVAQERKVELRKQMDSGNTQIRLGNPPVLFPEEYVYEYGANEVFASNYLQRPVVYRESVAPIDWEILPEEKSIEGMKAYKAKATFKGRNWEVWFTPEIPYSTGPWLLQGLPGLILEAQDEEKQVSFQFTHLQSESVKNQVIQDANEYNRIQISFFKILQHLTPEEYSNLLEEARKNPRQFKVTQIQSIGEGVNDPFFMTLSNDYTWLHPIKNPIAKERD